MTRLDGLVCACCDKLVGEAGNFTLVKGSLICEDCLNKFYPKRKLFGGFEDG